jgi:HEAT repeat protein
MKRIFIALTFASIALTARAADYAAQVNELIPKLATEIVTNRYAAQMELQAIASESSKPGNDAARAALGAVLAAKAADASVPQPARVWIVRQLEYMGRGEAVAALTALMNSDDAELRECARRALEKNPDQAATASLRAALKKGGDERWKIGLVRSLGQKRDADSVALIAPLLADAKVGSAAAKSLGSIATPEAVKALWSAFGKLDAVNESLICAANHDASQAVAIGTKLFAECPLSPVRAAALTAVAKQDKRAAAKLIDEALTGNDARLQKVAADLSSPEKLAADLPRLSESAKVFALRVIDSEKIVIGCAAEKGEAVRVAALERLSEIGAAASAPVLVAAAANGSELEKAAAAASLARVNGSGADKAIVKQAGQGAAALRCAAITALAARADKASLPALLNYAGEADATVSKAALAAVGKIGGDESLDGLVKLVLAGKDGAKDALLVVANRSANKSVVGQKLAAQAQSASGAQLTGVFDAMSLVGGSDSLAAVVKFTETGSEEVKDAAIRALCQWREFAAVEPLLKIASAAGGNLKHQVLAIQAACRLVKSSETEPSSARVNASLGALKAATRPQEKTQALSALASVKDRAAADALIKLLADPAVNKDAAHAALTLADAIRKQDRGSAKKLGEAVKKANISPDLTKKAEQSLNKK